MLTTIKLSQMKATDAAAAVGTVISPDAARSACRSGARNRSVGVFDVKSRTLTRMIERRRPARGESSASTGGSYAANGPSGDVSVVDIASNRREARARGRRSVGIAVATRWRIARCAADGAARRPTVARLAGFGRSGTLDAD